MQYNRRDFSYETCRENSHLSAVHFVCVLTIDISDIFMQCSLRSVAPGERQAELQVRAQADCLHHWRCYLFGNEMRLQCHSGCQKLGGSYW